MRASNNDLPASGRQSSILMGLAIAAVTFAVLAGCESNEPTSPAAGQQPLAAVSAPPAGTPPSAVTPAPVAANTPPAAVAQPAAGTAAATGSPVVPAVGSAPANTPKTNAPAAAGVAAPTAVEPAPAGKVRTPESERAATDLQAGDIIRAPKQGGPAWAIQEVLAAASETDEEAGWKRFEAILHSSQKYARALEGRRKLNYPAARRKVGLFLKEKGPAPVFKISRIIKEKEGRLRLYIDNTGGMPTPCVVAPDPAAKGAWRVETCSL